MESGYEAAKGLLRAKPDVTAIFATNDPIAIGAMRAAAGLSKCVPDELSVIGSLTLRSRINSVRH
jgi:DNA-binding LacI/PurR family transcriptional regulator